MRRISSNSESGAILLIVIILMLALTITGVAFLNAGVMEYRLAKREDYKNKAFYIAEGGLERTLWNLKQDFVNSTSTPDWTDGYINNTSVGEEVGDWRVLDYAETSLGAAGSYEVKLKYVYDAYDEVTGEPIPPPRTDRIWVRSTGTFEGVSRTVQVLAEIINVFPWNNAIFAGVGSGAGTVIKGNSRVHGSVLILGKGLGEEAMAMDFSGDAGIRNNYDGMDPLLVPIIPSCPTVTLNPETVESLDAMLRVKHGQVVLGGSSTVGVPNNPGDDFKETMDGVFANDGFDIQSAGAGVYSDNGSENPYDLGDTVVFPSLTNPVIDPVTGQELYPTYLDYLDANSLDIPIGINKISSDVASFSFSSSDGKNSISWDQIEGELHVEGIIWVLADSLDLGKKDGWIKYTGKGTIVVAKHNGTPTGIAGDIRVHGHLVAKGNYEASGGTEGFPAYALGLITNNMELATGSGESQLIMTGAFFAQEQIISQKQNEIGGTFVSNYFDITKNVPRIYQVPELANNMPPGMPGGDPIWYFVASQWSES